MDVVSADSINYGILCDAKAVIQSWNDSITTLLPRNYVIFNGTRICIAHLRTAWFSDSVETVLIPYSLQTIYCFESGEAPKLEYLIFEFGSELRAILDGAFAHSGLRSLFLPPTLLFLAANAFIRCDSVACVHFGFRSSLGQLRLNVFAVLRRICAITIPSSVKCIDDAFGDCHLLRVVRFELPSQCWCISTLAFAFCPLLERISLPSSVEFIEDPVILEDCFLCPIDGGNFLIRDDCLIRTNGRELIRYLGSSQTFCVSRDMAMLPADGFSSLSSHMTLNFEPPLRITHFHGCSFSYCIRLRFVEVPNSVCFIGKYCFACCTGLKEVVFESPAAVRRIESHAFYECSSLTSFTVPSSVSSLGDSFFEGCNELTYVTFGAPSRLTTISDRLFCCCPSLTNLTLPDSVTAVAPDAFCSSGLTSIIGSDWAISSGLVVHRQKVSCCLGTPLSIRIPGNVREIGDRAFFSDNSLIDLSFEEGTVRIGSDAFDSFSNLANAAFPASLIGIEANAFGGCDRLRRITFAVGSQLQYIRGKAFSKCPLNYVAVPASIREIDPSAFSRKVWRSCVIFEGPPLFLIDDDFILSLDSRVVLRHLSDEPESLIGSNIEVIGANAFGWTCVSSVLFESGTRLMEIDSESFTSCDKLEAFNVPESVEILGDRCFKDCCKMETITFEGLSRLKRIGEHSFMGCKLHSIVIPAMVEEIDG
jgi:hypothetical protein